jgi:secretion/DNA translocation related CpaE-like protein
VLVDLDPLGGGLDLMLGAEGETGARWEELAGITGTVDESVLLEALPQANGLPLLTWSDESVLEPSVAAVGHVLDALARPPGAVVVDGGRLTDPRAAVALARCQRLVVVLPMRVRAVAAAQRLLQRVSRPTPPTIVASGPAPGGLSTDDVASALSLPVAAQLPHDRRRPVEEEVGGAPPTSAAWQRVCRELLEATADAAA